MELRLYWRIVKKRLWIIILLLAVVSISTMILQPERTTTYTAGMRFVVGIEPEPPGDYYRFDRYYTWLTAEYLVDDLAEVVKSEAFARDVAEVAGLSIPPGAIQAATSAGKLHRVLNVSVAWPDPELLATIANAVVSVLTEHAGVYFAQLSTESAVVSLIDSPVVLPVGASLRERLDLPLRLALALVAGVGLTFLFDYLDPTVRHRGDIEDLGLSILAEIPARRRRWAFWRVNRSKL